MNCEELTDVEGAVDRCTEAVPDYCPRAGVCSAAEIGITCACSLAGAEYDPLLGGECVEEANCP